MAYHTWVVPPSHVAEVLGVTAVVVGCRKVWMKTPDGDVAVKRSDLPTLLPEDFFELCRCICNAAK